jgi:hypothetical protein
MRGIPARLKGTCNPKKIEALHAESICKTRPSMEGSKATEPYGILQRDITKSMIEVRT